MVPEEHCPEMLLIVGWSGETVGAAVVGGLLEMTRATADGKLKAS